MTLLLTTKQCPECKQTARIPVDDNQYNRMLDRYKTGEYTSAILTNYGPDVWERFVSGYCPECWDKLMGDDDE